MTKDSDNLTVLPTGVLSLMEQNLVDVKSEFNTFLEFQGINAKLIRAKYLALIEEGFTESQALELSKQ